MKPMGKFILIICIIFLCGCNKFQADNIDSPDKKTIPALSKKTTEIKNKEEVKDIPLHANNKPADNLVESGNINLNSEDNIKDYLIGNWISDKENLSDYMSTESDINCNMIIDENLNVDFSFYNRQTNESKGHYSGQISLDRLYAKEDEPPDLISIDLGQADWPGGDFLFKHRTIYDDKIVMSLFFSGNGNCIFDLLGDIDNFEYAPEEIILEKKTDEQVNLDSLKSKEFYAVFWGEGEDDQSIWMDEVRWTPTEEYDPDALYPTRMTMYEDDLPISSLYKISKENSDYISYTNKFSGEVYYVKTDKDGNIIEMEDASYKEYIDTINKP